MNTKQLSIAICDDDGPALALMEELVNTILRLLEIERDDVELTPTQDHREAENLASSGKLDLLITDLMWPGVGETEWRQGLNIVEFARSANPRTVIVLVTAKTAAEKDFRHAAQQRGADWALTWDEAFGSGRGTYARQIAQHLSPNITSAVPKIVGVDQATIGLVGLDTVAFSETDDDFQQDIVKSFLGHVSDAWSQFAVRRVRPIFVFTGDGLYLGLVGDEGPRLAFDVGSAAWRQITRLARYRTRMAIHSGPVNVAALSTGGQQLLGHSVNWLFRAVNAAPDDGLVVTDQYYATVLQEGRAPTPGFKFERRQTEAKHGRELVLHDVTLT